MHSKKINHLYAFKQHKKRSEKCEKVIWSFTAPDAEGV